MIDITISEDLNINLPIYEGLHDFFLGENCETAAGSVGNFGFQIM